MKRATAWTIFSIVMVVFVFCFIIPLGSVVKGGFINEGQFTTEFIRGVFENPIYREGLFNSLMLGLGTTVLATLISLPLAWLANRFKFPLKSMFTALVLVPMILPPFVGAIGFQQILGQYGVLNAVLGLGPIDWLGNGRYFGVILLQSLALYPICLLYTSPSPRDVEESRMPSSA